MENIDCLEGLKKLKDNSIDLCFCDLPYGNKTTALKWDNMINMKEFSKQIWRVSKPETPIVFTCNMKFGFEIINAMGKKYFKYEIIWEKYRPMMPMMARIRPLKIHEYIFVFYKKQPKIYNIKLDLYHKKEYPRKTESKELVTNTIYGDLKFKKKYTRYNPRLPKSIMKFYSSTENRINKTQKPVELVEWFIKYYTDEGALVLDPTFGSGTTAVACKNLNRKFIGFEKDEIQYKKAIQRVNSSNKK